RACARGRLARGRFAAGGTAAVRAHGQQLATAAATAVRHACAPLALAAADAARPRIGADRAGAREPAVAHPRRAVARVRSHADAAATGGGGAARARGARGTESCE